MVSGTWLSDTHLAGLKRVPSIVYKPHTHSIWRSLCSPLACSLSGAKATRGKVIEKTNQERYPTHAKWGFLEGREEKLDMGGGDSFDLPTVQACLSSPSAHFSPPLPPSKYSACSSKCMNAWMAWQNTLQDLFLSDNLAFFFRPC